MHPRVTPSETRLQETILPNYIQEEHEMPSSFVSNQAVVEVFTAASPNARHGEEEMLKACEEIYSPILKSMKLFGIYFGETSLKKVSLSHWFSCFQGNLSVKVLIQGES